MCYNFQNFPTKGQTVSWEKAILVCFLGFESDWSIHQFWAWDLLGLWVLGKFPGTQGNTKAWADLVAAGANCPGADALRSHSRLETWYDPAEGLVF